MIKGTILIVDDEPEILELCARALQRGGYQVWAAGNAREAISRVQRGGFDLLLTDVRMPYTSGLDLAQALKQIDPEILCVTMTGFGTMDLAVEALKLGIDDFIVKPFTPDELCLAVSRAFEKRLLRRDNARLRALVPLFELSKSFMATVDIKDLLQHVVQIARQETLADRASLFQCREGRDGSELYGWVGSPAMPPSAAEQALEARIASQVAEARQLIVWPPRDSTAAPAPFKGEDSLIPAFLASPLLAKDELVGVLVVSKDNRTPAFAASDGELLSVLSGQAAIALENARLFKEIQDAYAELQKLDHLKSEFINIAAHELRTPLALLMGYVGILQEEVSEDLKVRVKAVDRSVLRLRTIVDDLVSLQALEAGKAYVRVTVFSIAEAIESAVADLQSLAEEKNHSITLEIAPPLKWVKSDRGKLDTVLLNLLSNAIKFTPPGGEIGILARRTDDGFEVAISDNGIGIPKEEQELIFSRFYQIEESLTRQHNGLGVGLSIARGMLALCGGTIRVESEVGRGSCFTIAMPQDWSRDLALSDILSS